MVKLKIYFLFCALFISSIGLAHSATPKELLMENCLQSDWIGKGFKNKENFDQHIKPLHCECVAKESTQLIEKLGGEYKQEMYQNGAKYLSEDLKEAPFEIDNHGTIKIINHAQVLCVENSSYLELWSQFLSE